MQICLIVSVRCVRVAPPPPPKPTARGSPPRASLPAAAAAPRAIRPAGRPVERLAYTRTQAAQALGISRSTFNRRVLPLLETVEMPWGTQLIPADELERLLAEQRRRARTHSRRPARPPGRPATLAPELVDHIRSQRAAGKTLAQIARDLNRDGTPTAHGGKQWWPSTIRAILQRT